VQWIVLDEAKLSERALKSVLVDAFVYCSGLHVPNFSSVLMQSAIFCFFYVNVVKG
jgi:hypothetical protein